MATSMQRILRIVLAAGLAAGMCTQAVAQERRHEEGRHGEGRHEEGRDWHDRDIHRFNDHDFDRWRGGHWYHGAHGGRRGWWWVIGPTRYFYPQPVYPYPDPYQPPLVAAPPPPVAAAPPQLYYYCDRPAGYYPYVPVCRTPWRAVPVG
jgi:hypothetical protein